MRVDSKATPAGRTLGQGGTIVLGNEQEGSVGTGMDDNDIFGGELYKLNIFTRKLSDNEVKEMSEERCSEVEMKYGDERMLKWEDVLQERKYGNVTEKNVDDECKILIQVWKKLQNTKRELDAANIELRDSHKKLNDNILQLSSELNDALQNATIERKIMNRKTKGERQNIKDESKNVSGINIA